jgi:hypothetical protein
MQVGAFRSICLHLLLYLKRNYTYDEPYKLFF